MKKLFFTSHGCFDIDNIVCIKYLKREALYEVSFKNTTDHFWLTEEQYECLQNDLEDIYEESWYAECDFEYDEDNDEANELQQVAGISRQFDGFTPLLQGRFFLIS